MLKQAVVLASVVAVLGAYAPATARLDACTSAAISTFGCTSNGGESLVVSASQETQRTHPTLPQPPSRTQKSSSAAPDVKPSLCGLGAFAIPTCIELPSPETEQAASSPALLPISVSDLAQFSPAPTVATAEPGNVGIADLPTNFTASAQPQVQTGELFGVPITVRFAPSTYLYDYGDGTTATLTAPGQTWEALGQPQFTPTPTTHVYGQRGDYTATVAVGYTVEIDLGTGWIALAGQITIPGTPQIVRILEAHTALVAHTCTEDPDGIGC